MEQVDIISEEEQIKFRDWLELNINNITWEGRYSNEFYTFWDNFFVNDIEIVDQFEKLNKAVLFVKSGPLISWFQWLKEKLLCFLFISKKYSILELSPLVQMSPREISVILRNFFVERFPHLEEEFNEKFQVSHVTCENSTLTFEKVVSEFSLNTEIRGTLEDDILKNLEVTLYADWTEFSNSIFDKDNNEMAQTIKSIKDGTSFKKQIKFFQELVLLFIVGGLLIFGIKVGNKWYEDYLVKKITLFEPSFFWLDKNLSFKTENPLDKKSIELSHKELEELEKLESKNVFNDDFEVKRFDVESDVVLTSVDALPKDFTVADLEQSDYEEVRKGGYRDVRYGRRKAFRVMMTSVNPVETKNKLIKLLDEYKVKQVDNVKPGTEIPGGIYFNIYVPREVISNFLSQVSSVETSTILESKTVFGGPAGTNKVFIWIKEI